MRGRSVYAPAGAVGRRGGNLAVLVLRDGAEVGVGSAGAHAVRVGEMGHGRCGSVWEGRDLAPE